MNVLIIIKTQDGETIYNAMRLANVGVKKGDQVSVRLNLVSRLTYLGEVSLLFSGVKNKKN